MKNNPSFKFDVNQITNTISVSRVFAASLPLVWDAWSKPELLDQWWASDGWESNTKSMEFKIDGYRHYVMKGPEDGEFWGLTSYLKIELHKGFSGKECFADEHAVINQEYPQSDYSLVFHEQGDETRIEHTTIYQSMAELADSLQFGFEQGTIDAYARLDGLLMK